MTSDSDSDGEGPPRRNSRTTKGKPSGRYGHDEEPQRRMETPKVAQAPDDPWSHLREFDPLHQAGIQQKPNSSGAPVTPKEPKPKSIPDDLCSRRSRASTTRSDMSRASAVLRRQAQAKLELEQTLVDAEASMAKRKLERQRQGMEALRKLEEEDEEKELARIKRLAHSKMELTMAEIRETEGSFYNYDSDSSQKLSDDEVSVGRGSGKGEKVFPKTQESKQFHKSRDPPLMTSTPKAPPNTPLPVSTLEETVRELANAVALAYKKPVKPPEEKMDRFLVRQTMGKDLPIFSGEPEEWPGFLAEFQRSTKMCGFSLDENLNRLRKCLKGKAKDAVQAMLVAPKNVDHVIKTLQLNFGKPAYIIETLIEKAKKTPSPNQEKPETLIAFSNSVSNLVVTMESLDRPEYMGNPVLVRELTDKLPMLYRLSWAKKKTKIEEKMGTVSLKDFSHWLQTQAEYVSEIWTPKATDFEKSQKDGNRAQEKKTKPLKEKVFVAEQDSPKEKIEEKKVKSHEELGQGDSAKSKTECEFCSKKNHSLPSCFTFAKESPEDRTKFVKEKGICFSCLKAHHLIKFCKEKVDCGVNECTKKHHKLLHIDEEDQKAPQVSGHVSGKCENQVLLRVIPVTLQGPKGKIETFAFLDDGSTCSMIEAEVANKVGIRGPIEPFIVKGIHGVTSKDEKSERVKFQIFGVNKEKSFILNNVKKVQHLGIPDQSVNVKKLAERWSYLKNVGVESLKNARPTVLLGEDNIDLIIAREVVQGPANAPCLSKTKLGWVIHGNVAQFQNRVDEEFIFSIFQSGRDEELYQIVKDTFKTESFGVRIPEKLPESKENERARVLMEKNTEKFDGKYVTGLLWKTGEVKLPRSREMAMKRLTTAEKKMDRDPSFAKWYQEKIDEYLAKGYVKFLSPEEANVVTPRTWYLPHFGVKHPNKPGKIRFVFDAAAKSQGTSLNDNLLQGPDILNSLVGTLFKFRQRKFGFGGDMKDFFHQVQIKEEDQQAQRFLWRGMDRSGEPQTLVIQVLFFGASCSPYSANFVKNLNANTYSEEFPEASKAILNRHYVDDYWDSADTEEEGIGRIQDVITVHSRGGFEIGKWTSSSKKILSKIPSELRNMDSKSIDESNELPYERTLGLVWNPNSDSFSFNLKFPKVKPEIVKGTQRPTKRQVLQLVMSIFDPLGFLAHYTVKARILLQQVWRIGIGWDDELPEELFEKFKLWVGELDNVAQVRIRRCYTIKTTIGGSHNQLHIFCDASEQAFSVVVYIRSSQENQVDVSFVMARTRVAPLRFVSIPRLELQAAVMGSRLAVFIRDEHEVKFNETWFWTDSQTVLKWVRSDARIYKTFVAHRIGEILEVTDVAEWRWIPTDLNVADDATRDSFPTDLRSDSRWWRGPEFLREQKKEWPQEESLGQEVDPQILELKKDVVALAKVESVGENLEESLPILDRFCSWLRLLGSTARALQFVQVCKDLVGTRRTGVAKNLKRYLTIENWRKAELLWTRRVQQESFPAKIAALKAGLLISKKSRLSKLSPFLDDLGILRMKGRIGAAPGVSDQVKFPVFLEPKHHYTRLLVDFYHVQAGHNGLERVVNEIRQKYCILDMRQAVKSSWSRCQKCKINRAAPRIPEMGSLPPCRLTPHLRPFTLTGMDYFGPMNVTIGRRHEKRYGVLFTCLGTRAVHMEIAHSLTTDSCIMAIRRMISRRGPPKEIHSDNGTNLKGADRELREALNDMDQAKIKEFLTPKGIDWHFIPPSAPHMGGSWERLVRSVKVALRAILNERAPKEEVLETLVIEAEAMVNSHPLTHVSADPNDPESLTPNHFLIGSSSGVQPPGVFTDRDLCLRNQWRISQRLADHFWKRWLKEYLPTLANRAKWHSPADPIKIGDVVFIADGDLPRGCWPRGIIVATYPGKDGKIRVVDVKTVTGIFRRPVVKIVVLDVRTKLDEGDPSTGGRMSATDQKVHTGPQAEETVMFTDRVKWTRSEDEGRGYAFAPAVYCVNVDLGSVCG